MKKVPIDPAIARINEKSVAWLAKQTDAQINETIAEAQDHIKGCTAMNAENRRAWLTRAIRESKECVKFLTAYLKNRKAEVAA